MPWKAGLGPGHQTCTENTIIVEEIVNIHDHLIIIKLLLLRKIPIAACIYWLGGYGYIPYERYFSFPISAIIIEGITSTLLPVQYIH